MKSFKEYIKEDNIKDAPNNLSITINLDNVALNNDGYLAVEELNRIFDSIINTIKNQNIIINQKFNMPLKDINGNTVGKVTI